MGAYAQWKIENMAYQNIITGEFITVPEKHYDFNLAMADMVAQKSKDENTKVGCVVTDENFVIISTGYNGPNRKAFDTNFNFSREPKKVSLMRNYPHLDLVNCSFVLEKHSFMMHAEINAMVNCTNRNAMKDSIVFVTHYTCTPCLNTLIQSGVKRIVVADNKHSAYQMMLPQILYLMENSLLPPDFFLVQKN